MKRSSFIETSAALAAATFLRGTALGAEAGAADDTMAALVETLLPFGLPSFPRVPPSEIISRIGETYALETSPAFIASLSAFSNTAAFPAGSKELFLAEHSGSPQSAPGALLARDAAAFAASGVPLSATFAALGWRDRDRYLTLWSQSAFNTRRRFYRAVRAVTFAALYSMPAAWRSIGYAGPLLKTPIQ
jgi:hypothetical protein